VPATQRERAKRRKGKGRKRREKGEGDFFVFSTNLRVKHSASSRLQQRCHCGDVQKNELQ
jgi:hypothetical protein